MSFAKMFFYESGIRSAGAAARILPVATQLRPRLSLQPTGYLPLVLPAGTSRRLRWRAGEKKDAGEDYREGWAHFAKGWLSKCRSCRRYQDRPADPRKRKLWWV